MKTTEEKKNTKLKKRTKEIKKNFNFLKTDDDYATTQSVFPMVYFTCKNC